MEKSLAAHIPPWAFKSYTQRRGEKRNLDGSIRELDPQNTSDDRKKKKKKTTLVGGSLYWHQLLNKKETYFGAHAFSSSSIYDAFFILFGVISFDDYITPEENE